MNITPLLKISSVVLLLVLASLVALDYRYNHESKKVQQQLEEQKRIEEMRVKEAKRVEEMRLKMEAKQRDLEEEEARKQQQEEMEISISQRMKHCTDDCESASRIEESTCHMANYQSYGYMDLDSYCSQVRERFYNKCVSRCG